LFSVSRIAIVAKGIPGARTAEFYHDGSQCIVNDAIAYLVNFAAVDIQVFKLLLVTPYSSVISDIVIVSGRQECLAEFQGTEMLIVGSIDR
jgi:hypothetical protein